LNHPLEITAFRKTGGPLTKQIALGEDGTIKSDGSACVLIKGIAHRIRFAGISQYSELLVALESSDAIVGGALRPDLPDAVFVITKRALNGCGRPGVIARTTDFINYYPGRAALALIDFDLKGMPPAVVAAMNERGGLWPALQAVCEPLARAARVERASTSSGLFHAKTGEQLNGSGGKHVYVLVTDGADIERFLKRLHERCWLGGFGWMLVGAAGQLLERSLVDRVVGTPERLIFEGPPILIDPVAQDQAARRPIVTEGEAIDTVAACPPLTVVELTRLEELRAKEAHRLSGDRARARQSFIAEHSRRLALRTGMDEPRARRVVERQCDGVLLPDVELFFDDPELAGKIVADILANPDEFEGETLSDPIEGPEYGRGKAKIMRRPDGSVWIHSFAHGGAVYELRQDFAAFKAGLEKAEKDEAAHAFVRLALIADLTEAEVEQLKHVAADRSGVGVRALAAMLKSARLHKATEQAQQERQRRLAERRDPRPRLPAPPDDGEYGPVMKALNAILRHASGPEPPTRNPNKTTAMAREIRVPSLHALTNQETNLDDDPKEPPAGAGTADLEAAE
jgi:hypothetical protein